MARRTDDLPHALPFLRCILLCLELLDALLCLLLVYHRAKGAGTREGLSAANQTSIWNAFCPTTTFTGAQISELVNHIRLYSMFTLISGDRVMERGNRHIHSDFESQPKRRGGLGSMRVCILFAHKKDSLDALIETIGPR